MEATDHVELGPKTLSFEHADLGEVSVPVTAHSSEGSGSVGQASLGSGPLHRVVVHWLNLPWMMPADTLRDPGRVWAGRVEMVAGPWRLTLDSRPDHSKMLSELEDEERQYAVTHIGQIERVDGAAFENLEALRLLQGWQLALSFALGRWVAPAFPVGFDGSDHRVWEFWAPWRCDGNSGYQSWWDPFTADDLADYVSRFLVSWFDAGDYPVVRHVAHHVIAANHAGMTGEARVMLAHAGLQYLGWVDFVLSGRIPKKRYRDLPAEEQLRMLLTRARIPTSIPQPLEAVEQVGRQRHLDGPGVCIWLRNRLVHPKSQTEPYEVPQLVWQCSQLFLEYGELLLLERLGYAGHYQRRYPPGRWAHDRELVPFNQE